MKIILRLLNNRKNKREIKNENFGKKYNITLNKEEYNRVKEDNRPFAIS